MQQIDIIINPILDTDYVGGLGNLIFSPAERLAYNINSKCALAIEEYATYGPLRRIYSANAQFHQLWGVFDCNNQFLNIEAGVGFGLTNWQQ